MANITALEEGSVRPQDLQQRQKQQQEQQQQQTRETEEEPAAKKARVGDAGAPQTQQQQWEALARAQQQTPSLTPALRIEDDTSTPTQFVEPTHAQKRTKGNKKRKHACAREV